MPFLVYTPIPDKLLKLRLRFGTVSHTGSGFLHLAPPHLQHNALCIRIGLAPIFFYRLGIRYDLCPVGGWPDGAAKIGGGGEAAGRQLAMTSGLRQTMT